MEITNAVYVDNVLPGPGYFITAKNITVNNELIGNDGNPVKVKTVVKSNDTVDLYRVSFLDRMNMIVPGTQSFMTINLLTGEMRDVTINEMIKNGPITPDGRYQYQVPTSPRITDFGTSKFTPEEKLEMIESGDGFHMDAVFGSVEDRQKLVDLLFKDGEFITPDLKKVFMIGTIVRSLGYILYTKSDAKVYTCTVNTSFLANKVSTVSGIEKLKENGNVVGIGVDNKDNTFIGPNFTLMYGL